MAKTEWQGAEALREMLHPLNKLEAFPGNPRLGNVEAIAQSFKRFGQLKPIVVDGRRVIAGHHMVQAAHDVGWTHIAVISNDFGSEDEQRAFLLADNRTFELGGFDATDLVIQLAALNDLTGTGYTHEDLDAMQQMTEYVANLNPSIESMNVTDDMINRAEAGLAVNGGDRKLVEVLCPACAHRFYLSADDMPRPEE